MLLYHVLNNVSRRRMEVILISISLQELDTNMREKDIRAQLKMVALLVIRGGERVMSPERRRARRGGLCLDTEHCARTGRRRGRAAASPARGRGAAAATSAVATTPLPWC